MATHTGLMAVSLSVVSRDKEWRLPAASHTWTYQISELLLKRLMGWALA
jgi:hypothetical protein